MCYAKKKHKWKFGNGKKFKKHIAKNKEKTTYLLLPLDLFVEKARKNPSLVSNSCFSSLSLFLISC
jgi:hypothetical protein